MLKIRVLGVCLFVFSAQISSVSDTVKMINFFKFRTRHECTATTENYSKERHILNELLFRSLTCLDDMLPSSTTWCRLWHFIHSMSFKNLYVSCISNWLKIVMLKEHLLIGNYSPITDGGSIESECWRDFKNELSPTFKKKKKKKKTTKIIETEVPQPMQRQRQDYVCLLPHQPEFPHGFKWVCLKQEKRGRSRVLFWLLSSRPEGPAGVVLRPVTLEKHSYFKRKYQHVARVKSWK